MTQHVVELVTFRLEEGVSNQAFLDAVPCSTAFIERQPGFIARRLSCTEDDLWIEHIEWASLEDAKAAAVKIAADPSVTPFVRCIDEPSARLMHAPVAVSIG